MDALFNVNPVELLDARIEFALSLPVLLLACLLAAVVTAGLSGYVPPRGRLRPLLFIRVSLAVLLVLVLARPEVVLPVPDTARAPVTVVMDDSLSMGIADDGGVTRGEQVHALFRDGEGALRRELQSRFTVRMRRFSAALTSADGQPPSFQGAVSDPLGALLEAVAAGPSSGLVLVSDGGNTHPHGVNDALLRLRAAGVPVHVVGVGGAGPSRDARVRAVSAPAVALPGDEVDLTAWVETTAGDGETVRVTVRDAGVLLAEREAAVAGGRAVVRLPVVLDEPGARALAVEVHTGAEDALPQNNRAWQPLRVRARPARVLHFEGEPRYEVKFLRRAVTGDPAIALASLVRTGDNRFLRLGLASADELADGFPATAETLFPYDVVVLGSAEAATFGERGLALLQDFVERRGASVLFLGGRRALAEGGFGATPVADLLPLRLSDPDPAYRRAVAVALTRDGERHPVTRDLMLLDGAARPVSLPALAVVNPVRRAKPGASVLLRGEDGGETPIAMLAWHRVGAGRVAVLPARDTWRWRMHADVTPDDRTHALFWRRLLRWLGREVPQPVEVALRPAVAAPGQSVQVLAWPRDTGWRLRHDARPQVEVTTPVGEVLTLPMVWEATDGGVFAARFTARDPGVHEARVRVPVDGGEPMTGDGGVMVSAVGDEFRHVTLDEALLRRIAAETGGSYRHASSVSGLVEQVAASAPVTRELRRVALWDAPVLLLVLLTLAALEWWLRRRRRALP